MAVMNGYQQYAESKVTTASKGKLLLMAYEGAIRFIRQAEMHMAQKHIEEQNTYIKKAQQLILELSATLNDKANPELAHQLRKIYDYMFNRLVEANISDDPKGLQEVMHLLEELRSAWEEADRHLTMSGAEGEMSRHSLYAAG